jgi:hypothetical protein
VATTTPMTARTASGEHAEVRCSDDIERNPRNLKIGAT